MSTLFGGQQLTQPSLFNTSFNSASIQQQQQQQQQNQQNQQPQQPTATNHSNSNQEIQQQQPQQPLWLQNQKREQYLII